MLNQELLDHLLANATKPRWCGRWRRRHDWRVAARRELGGPDAAPSARGVFMVRMQCSRCDTRAIIGLTGDMLWATRIGEPAPAEARHA